MPTKTTRDQVKRKRPGRPYVDLYIGQIRITAPKRTVGRTVRAAKRAVRRAVNLIVTLALGGAGTALTYLISRR